MLDGYARVFPLPIQCVQGEGQPAYATLDGNKVEVREAVANSTADQLRDSTDICDEDRDANRCEVRMHSIISVAIVLQQGPGALIAGRDMEVDRQPHLLRNRPKPIPVTISEAGQSVGGRLLRQNDPVVAHGRASLNFSDARVQIPKGNRRQWQQPLWICA